jgi:SanA protein
VKRRTKVALAVAASSVSVAGLLDRLVASGARVVDPAAAPQTLVAIVPGAGVLPSGELSSVLRDRVDVAIELHRAGKVRKLLLSGDHGRASYDEPRAMARRAESAGVPPEDLFLDHAGFDTHATIHRARAVFGVERALIVTQAYHLPRALYYARRIGIDATGVVADRRAYERRWFYAAREVPARLKAFAVTTLELEPLVLGPAIPISGDGRATRR